MRLMTRIAGASLCALVAALALSAPATAQEGSRYRVLVPNLEPQQRADADFGEDVANELRDMMEEMATHEPVAEREVRDALRRFRIDEDDLDCVRARQLAVQLGAELVMCGTYTPAPNRHQTVSASFVAARTGERFEVAPFQATRDRDAARHIFDAFTTYVDQIRQTTFCVEYLGSQQYATALETCQGALAANPQSTTALYAVSRARLGIAEEKDANDAYVLPEEERTALLNESLHGLQRVLEINPMHQEAIQSAGFVAVKLDQRDLARQYYRQYLDLNPGATSVRVSIATDLANAGDPEGALNLVVEGVELGGDAPDPVLLEYAGHFAMTAAGATQGSTIATGPLRTPAELYDVAIQYYQRAQQARGAETSPALLRRLIQALASAERTDEAILVAEQGLATTPDDPGLLDAYANTLNDAGRIDEAIGALQRLAQVDTAARIYAQQGVWLVDAQRFDDARTAFRRAMERGEVSGDGLADRVAFIGNQALRDGRTETAVEAFELSRELASSEVARARGSFYAGYALYQRAANVERPATPASARAALPIFQRAQAHFRQAGPFAATEPSTNLSALLEAVSTYIARQEQIMARPR